MSITVKEFHEKLIETLGVSDNASLYKQFWYVQTETVEPIERDFDWGGELKPAADVLDQPFSSLIPETGTLKLVCFPDSVQLAKHGNTEKIFLSSLIARVITHSDDSVKFDCIKFTTIRFRDGGSLLNFEIPLVE